jgi:hypothetical protein
VPDFKRNSGASFAALLSMKRMFQALWFLPIALIFVPAVEAGPIIYFDTYRSLNINGMLFETTATGEWSASGGQGPNRSQRSFIGERLVDAAANPFERIRASGDLNMSSFDGATNLSTDLFTSFVLDSPYTAILRAFVDAENAGYAEGFLFDETTQTMLAQAMVDDGVAQLRYEGILQPGVYSYYLMAEVMSPGGTGPFVVNDAAFGGDLTLTQFTPVPEPGTMALLGLGLAAAWRRRRAMNHE